MNGEAWRVDEDGDLDDIVVPEVRLFRMERMDEGQWWIGLTRADGSVVHLDVDVEDMRPAGTRVVVRRRED